MLVTDIETNGLLRNVSKFHCATIYDYRTGKYTKYRPKDFSSYLDALEAEVKAGGLVVFHNGNNYDEPALSKLAKLQLDREFHIPKEHLVDTLVLSRLLYPNMYGSDMALVKRRILPPNRINSHSLEAWGYRLGEMKGEYKYDYKKAVEASGELYTAGDEWLHFNERMMDYCVQDVVVTVKLLEKFLTNRWYFHKEDSEKTTEYERFWDMSLPCVWTEHSAAHLLAKQERNGFPFDKEFALKTQAKLQDEVNKILLDLRETFGSWYKSKTHTDREYFKHPKTGKALPKYPMVVYPKSGSMYTATGKVAKSLYFKDSPYTPVEYVSFNPASGDHLVKVLMDAGWKPTVKTDKGNWSTSEDVLQDVKVDNPIAQSKINLVIKYLMLTKRLGMFNNWIESVWEEDGCIHGSVNPNGASTGRATHSKPNLAQVTGAKFDKETHEPLWEDAGKWGCESRYVLGAGHYGDGSWYQVGVDASGLELRCLGHFMAPFDGGAYIEIILNGDIHTANQQAAGLPTRDNAKTFIYGFIYGAGNEKIGLIVGGDGKTGKQLKERFLESTPALATLRDNLQKALVKSSSWVGKEQKVIWKRKYIKGLDGRRVDLRSPHSALNFLLQGAGAVICKHWMIRCEERLQALGLKHGWDGDYTQMAWVHDEVQWAARTKEIAEIIVKEAQLAMRDVGEFYNFRCQLDTEGKIGKTWMDCH